MTSFDQLEKGSIFHGRYRVERRLGAGAMGAVYEVVDEKTQSLRALKVMQPALVREQVHRERFVQEAQITGKIESDHLVRVLDAGIDSSSGMPFLTMELLRGETLGDELKRRGVLPPDEMKRYLQQINFALTKTHAAGIVHRDLKPENLFVTRRDDGSCCLKILDFGIAKVVAGAPQNTVTRIGTPMYMAPEQLAGRGLIGPPTDIHALGHLAYEMLVGEPYWTEESRNGEGPLAFFERLREGPLELPSVRAKRRSDVTLPPDFDAWFNRAIAKNPEDRFASASEFVHAFERLFDDKPSWVARTVAAAPLVAVFDAPPRAADTVDIETVVRRNASLAPNAERDFEAATTIPRLPKRAPRVLPLILLGVAAAGCVLILLVAWSSGSGTNADNAADMVPLPSSFTPTVVSAEPVSPPIAIDVMPASSAIPVASSLPTQDPRATHVPEPPRTRTISPTLGKTTTPPSQPLNRQTKPSKGRPGVPY